MSIHGLATDLDNSPYFHRIGNMDKEIAIRGLSALAHETRLDLFRVLVQAGPNGLAAGAIGTVLDIPIRNALISSEGAEEFWPDPSRTAGYVEDLQS